MTDFEKYNIVYENSPDSGKKWILPDVVGKPAYSWDERGFRIRMEYDAAQRPLEKWVKNGSTNEVLKEKTVYRENATNSRIANLRGQVYEQNDQAGKQRFVAYDFKGNLKEEERQFATVYDTVLDYSGSVPLNTGTYTTAYQYDALNRPVEKTTPDESTCKYTYAKNALLQSETVAVRGSGTGSPAINDIKYDAKGQRTNIYYANGSKTKYEFDPATFRVKRILTTRNTGADVLQDLNYTYDAVGNITQQKDDAQQTIYFANQVVPPLCKYSYDSLYRLTKATGRELNGLAMPSATDCPIQTPVPDTDANACRNYTQNYQYDELGNILQIQHIVSGGNWTRNYYYPTTSNKLIGHTSGQTEYTYDAAGNMLSMPHLSNIAWDEDNMLVEANLGGGGTAYYHYDSGGQRVRKVIVNDNIKKERLYVGDWELWQQSVSGNVQTERETLNVSDDKSHFLQLETLTISNGSQVSSPTTNWRYQYDNNLGSACLELDANAAVISYEDYFPFGATSYRSGKSQAEVKLKCYRYCGKERDEESGLYYYGARYYASWLGRFVSIDPMAATMPAWSPYSYGFCNPIFWTDPTGAAPEPPSTDVRKNEDGSYTVVGAYDDGDKNIYVVGANGKRTGETIGTTTEPTEFMGTEDKTGGFSGYVGTTFNLNNLTVTGSVKPNKYTTATIYGADAQRLLDWGQELFRTEVTRQSPATFYGELEILRDMSRNYKSVYTDGQGSLDFKSSLGLPAYTAIKAGNTSDGKPIITTLRAVGNITFGANMRSTKPYLLGTPTWYYSKVMKEVGAYNQSQNKGGGYNSGFPYFGEHTYSGSYIYYGYFGKFYKK